MNREGKTWPGYIFGGRMRTSTLVLIVAFVGLGWLYETYEPPLQQPDQVPASEVVPPGFIPDPAYTWAPRTDVQRHTTTPTADEDDTTSPTTTPSTTPTTPTTSTAAATPTASTTPTSPANVPPGPPGPSAVTTPVAPPSAVTSTSAAIPSPPATPVPSSAVRPG